MAGETNDMAYIMLHMRVHIKILLAAIRNDSLWHSSSGFPVIVYVLLIVYLHQYNWNKNVWKVSLNKAFLPFYHLMHAWTQRRMHTYTQIYVCFPYHFYLYCCFSVLGRQIKYYKHILLGVI